MGISLVCLLELVVALVVIVLLIKLVRRQRPTQSMVICPACSRAIAPGASACPHCGHALGETPDDGLAKLVAVQGALAGREFTIPPPPQGLTIGRASANDVALPDDMLVSRHHAQVMRESGHYVLYDRNSVNGVFVNDQRVARHILADGDVVQVCNALFRFASGAAPPPPKPPMVSAPHADSMHLSGQDHFEGYILEKELGRGGMSVVYKARDAQGMELAIKVLNVTDPYLVRKFIQEGKIGAALRDHPCIRIVYHQGQSKDRRLYLVMEYIEGQSLRKLINQHVADAEIARLIGQVCDALHYAHQQNVVHRDIKPENVLVDTQGVVKVTDFGIAKLTSSVTVTSDRIVGTPEYLSPEQAQGKQRITPSSDIYALGVVLYEMLAGQPPFTVPRDLPPREATMSVLSDHIKTRPTPPGQIQPGVSKHLEQVAMKALEKDPRRRFATAKDMAQDLGFEQASPVSPPIRPMARVVVVQGHQAGRRIELGGQMTVLGREEIAPQDLQISRQHLSIVPQGDQLWLEDMSLNGTWVNGERVYGRMPLDSGHEIAVGSHVLRVEISSAPGAS
jgi:pSer/pThr/pTyr-binding forkhead associated (FHA) protein/predicted Ser/Thr protein kinase